MNLRRITKATILAPVRVIEGAVDAVDAMVNGPTAQKIIKAPRVKAPRVKAPRVKAPRRKAPRR